MPDQSSLETSLTALSKRLLTDIREEPVPTKIQTLTLQLQQTLEGRRGSIQNPDAVAAYASGH